MSGQRWESLMRELIFDIRKTNPNRWIIVGGDNWNSIDGLAKLEAPYDKRLVLTYHDYDPYNFTHQGASWFADAPPVGTEWGSAEQRANLTATVARAASIRQRMRMPVWLGEFGVHKTAPAVSRIKWTAAMREALEVNNIGWCVFDFAAEFAFWSPQTGQWNQPLLDTLLGDNFQLRK
jgi:endoglucanase